MCEIYAKHSMTILPARTSVRSDSTIMPSRHSTSTERSANTGIAWACLHSITFSSAKHTHTHIHEWARPEREGAGGDGFTSTNDTHPLSNPHLPRSSFLSHTTHLPQLLEPRANAHMIAPSYPCRGYTDDLKRSLCTVCYQQKKDSITAKWLLVMGEKLYT